MTTVASRPAPLPGLAPNPLDGYQVPKPPALSYPEAGPFPYATAPDIIRAQQKDAYFTGVLASTLSDVHRRFLGTRSAHSWAAESKTLAALVYFGLTTLLGHQTLGEEYCDIVSITDETAAPTEKTQAGDAKARTATGRGIQAPGIMRRAAYICGSIILPYILTRSLPKLRGRIRTFLEQYLARSNARLRRQQQAASSSPRKSLPAKPPVPHRIASYALTHLSAWTDPTHVHAISLALFYFTGSYYELSKRLAGLRYVFGRVPPELASSTPTSSALNSQRGGYEVLGVLLAAQMAVQAWQHVSSVLSPSASTSSSDRERPGMFLATSLSAADDAYGPNTSLLAPSAGAASTKSARLTLTTNTPPPPPGGARYDLSDPKTMAWIPQQARKCTLCLEPMRDPSATACGHVFCWECIGDWVREKPECPLCRREVGVGHVLPLRGL